jgi:iron(III) transport system ATP-binding protein
MSKLLKIENILCQEAPNPIGTPLSLQIQEAEIAVILSEGCSIADTLLRAIQGQIRINSGKIVLAGDHIATGNQQMASSRRKCSLVPASASLIPHLTAAQNIELALHGLRKQDRLKRLRQLLAEVDLLGIDNYVAAELTEEERQRTALARALASDPLLLLWEEPFGPYSEAHHMGLIDEIELICKQRNLTCLLSTTRLNAGFAIADSMAVFKLDRLLQWDKPAKLYQQPRYRDVARNTGNGTLLEGFIHPNNTLSSELGTLQFSADNLHIQTGKAIEFLLRPQHVQPEKRSLRCGTIIGKRFQGDHTDYRIRLEEGSVIPVSTPSHLDLVKGRRFCFRVEMDHLMVFRPGHELSIDLGQARSV